MINWLINEQWYIEKVFSIYMLNCAAYKITIVDVSSQWETQENGFVMSQARDKISRCLFCANGDHLPIAIQKD